MKTHPWATQVNTTTYGLKSWRYTEAKIWNALPDQFHAANKIRTFKNLMSKLDFSRNSCKYILLSFYNIM